LRIGVFDSGIGGLTVAKSLYESRLFREIIYFGDTARVPYGSKDKNTIIRYSLEAVEFFKNFDIELLVVACNSVSAYAIEQMREEADFPVVGVIESGVLALENSKLERDKNILVIGTEATISSSIYQTLLSQNGFSEIEALPTGLFVPIVEEGIFSGEVLNSTMRFYFNSLEKEPDHIILGCTHFPLIGEQISSFFPNNPSLTHSGDAIVEYLKSIYQNLEDGEVDIRFFASENPSGLKKVAKRWLNLKD
jgi:glutamate racemase